MLDMKPVMERLDRAYDEMRIVYEDGETEKYVDYHEGAPSVYSAVKEFVEGDICFGQLLDRAVDLQNRYGAPQGVLSPTDNKYVPEVPDFKSQAQYLVNAALFGGDKSDYHYIGSMDFRREFFSNYIYEMKVEQLIEFKNKGISYGDARKQEYRQPWTASEKAAAAKNYPLVLKEYVNFAEAAEKRRIAYDKVKLDVAADSVKYKDFDMDGYIAQHFPMEPEFRDDGYFRGNWYKNRYFDITRVFTKNPMYADILRRNYTEEEMSMRRNFDDPYGTFRYKIQRHLFGKDSHDECKPGFEYFDELLRMHVDPTEQLFNNEQEKAEYMLVARKCWEGLKEAKVEYGNFATILTSTKELKIGLFLFAKLSDRHAGVSITDGSGNRQFADGTHQKKTGDYGLVDFDLFGEEGASMRVSDLTKRRMSACLKEFYFEEARVLCPEVGKEPVSIRAMLGEGHHVASDKGNKGGTNKISPVK